MLSWAEGKRTLGLRREVALLLAQVCAIFPGETGNTFPSALRTVVDPSSIDRFPWVGSEKGGFIPPAHLEADTTRHLPGQRSPSTLAAALQGLKQKIFTSPASCLRTLSKMPGTNPGPCASQAGLSIKGQVLELGGTGHTGTKKGQPEGLGLENHDDDNDDEILKAWGAGGGASS